MAIGMGHEEELAGPTITRTVSSSLLYSMPSLACSNGSLSSLATHHESDRSPPPTGARHPSPPHNEGNYDWLVQRIKSGEAAALLSLSGNTAVGVSSKDVGSDVSYTVRGETTLPGEDEPHLEALSPAFEYTLIGVWGGAKGKVIALRPKATPRSVYLAFRGVRPAGVTEHEREAAAVDRENFLRATPVIATWLPDAQMRVHGGVLEHHNSLWDTDFHIKMRALAASSSRLKKAMAHASEAVESQLAQMASISPHGRWEKQPIDELVLCGLSLGGALAELTALRIASQIPALRPLIRVVSFGSIPWASPAISDHFDAMFGRRSVQLVLSRREPASKLSAGSEKPSWWVLDEPTERWMVFRSFLRGTRAQNSDYIVFDPLASALAPPRAAGLVPLCRSPDFFVLPNVIVCNQDSATIDPLATERLPESRIKQSQLQQLLTSGLRPDDQLQMDYDRLHIGKQYRALLVAMLRRHQKCKARAQEVKCLREASHSPNGRKPTGKGRVECFDENAAPSILQAVRQRTPTIVQIVEPDGSGLPALPFEEGSELSTSDLSASGEDRPRKPTLVAGLKQLAEIFRPASNSVTGAGSQSSSFDATSRATLLGGQLNENDFDDFDLSMV
ncbi:hypothetical protein AB1Y20_011387 [Prymnesium parvum]|uniref:Fungal lipase-type domain-containing protein n=1 Tax=Prymnesium parvum TaxID=97485 RepID=A0AB34IQC6_PRYPA